MSWKVKFFQTTREDFPVREFIDGLEKITQTKITSHIDLLKNYGPFLKPPYIKKISNELKTALDRMKDLI